MLLVVDEPGRSRTLAVRRPALPSNRITDVLSRMSAELTARGSGMDLAICR